jgi:hypothetical protein
VMVVFSTTTTLAHVSLAPPGFTFGNEELKLQS